MAGKCPDGGIMKTRRLWFKFFNGHVVTIYKTFNGNFEVVQKEKAGAVYYYPYTDIKEATKVARSILQSIKIEGGWI